MAQRHSGSSEKARQIAERTFWQAAFVAAQLPTLIGEKIAPEGTAQFAGEYADAALAEYRRRWGHL